MPPIGAQGLNFAVQPLPISLPPLAAFVLPPGNYGVILGRYTSIEFFDSYTGFWRGVTPALGPDIFQSDGGNWRLINRTGGPMGSIMTNLGSGYTSQPTVTVSSGNSVWRSIVGGAINTTVTVTTAGAYNYPPTLIFPPGPSFGFNGIGSITPTATVQISAGAISGVTVINRGAGLAVAPLASKALTFAQALQFNWAQQGNVPILVQDPRDTAAGGGVLTPNATLAGAGVVTAVLCTDPGNTALTSLPTLTFSGGGGTNAAATVIMNWTITGFTVGGGGGGYGNAQPFQVTGVGLQNETADASGDVNPAHNIGLVTPRNFLITGTSTSAGAVTATNAIIEDAGFGLQAVPTGVLTPANGAANIPSAAATVTMTVGGTTDISWLQQLK